VISSKLTFRKPLITLAFFACVFIPSLLFSNSLNDDFNFIFISPLITDTTVSHIEIETFDDSKTVEKINVDKSTDEVMLWSIHDDTLDFKLSDYIVNNGSSLNNCDTIINKGTGPFIFELNYERCGLKLIISKSASMPYIAIDSSRFYYSNEGLIDSINVTSNCNDLKTYYLDKKEVKCREIHQVQSLVKYQNDTITSYSRAIHLKDGSQEVLFHYNVKFDNKLITILDPITGNTITTITFK
jgi:hypothetical protein